MKKFYSFLFAVVALAGFAACNSDSTEEPAPEQEVGKMEFTANIGEDTKTQLTEGTKVKWCAEDAIAVSNGTDVKMYTIKEGTLSEDGKTAVFEGEELEGDVYYAIYPYVADAKYENGAWSGVAEPTEQTATAGSFADGAAVSEGTYNGDGSFSFTNESAILKFQVPAACSFVEFYNGETLAVKVVGEMAAEETYYAAVKPGKYTFTVRIDACLSKIGTKELNLEKNTIYNLKALPAKQTATVNLVPGIWTSANAWFAAYYWNGNSNRMVKMTDEDKDGAYTAEVAADAENIIFVRMNPENADLKWESKWNQTGSLALPTDDKTYYNIKPADNWEEDGQWLAKNEKLPYIYFKAGVWDIDSAVFRAWIWGGSVTGDGVWVLPYKYYSDYYVFDDKGGAELIFLRAKSGSTEWGDEYNRILETIPTDNWNNCYTVDGWNYGTWSHI